MNRFRRVAAAGVVALAVLVGSKPAFAQLVVFDPNNYAQNVLTAARALQQINNQITSLQNQAQMLVNQARNLASLPYSSLQQLEQSIQRTQQLLAQAQRISFDIQQIDRAFSTTYAPASPDATDQALIANAQVRWQNSVAGFQDAMRVQATVVSNLDTNRAQMSTLVTASRARPAPCKRARLPISFLRCRHNSLPISRQQSPLKDAPKTWNLPSERPLRTRAGSNSGAS